MRTTKLVMGGAALLVAQQVAVAQEITPYARANASTEAKVFVSDTLPGTNRRFTNSDGARGGENKLLPGELAQSTSNAAKSGAYRPPGGQLFTSSGSASARASAVGDFGVLKASVSGAGTGSGSEGVSSLAEAVAEYVDLIVIGGNSLSEVEFGFGLEATASAQFVDQGSAPFGGANSVASLRWSAFNLRTLQGQDDSLVTGSGANGTEPLSASVRISVRPGDTIAIRATLGARGNLGLGTGTANFTADAFNTAETFIRMLTPGMSYTAASGTLYATDFSWSAPIPEPHEYVLLGLGLLVIGVRARLRT